VVTKVRIVVLSVLCKISAGELREEEANERLCRMGQSGASILPRKTAGPVPGFDKGNRPCGLFDTYVVLLRSTEYKCYKSAQTKLCGMPLVVTHPLGQKTRAAGHYFSSFQLFRVMETPAKIEAPCVNFMHDSCG
jgi:hypothetical protein